jgi:hypothetical protein
VRLALGWKHVRVSSRSVHLRSEEKRKGVSLEVAKEVQKGSRKAVMQKKEIVEGKADPDLKCISRMNGCVTGHRAGHGVFEVNLGYFCGSYDPARTGTRKIFLSCIRSTSYELRALR